MRMFKLIGAIAVVLAFSAVAVATASAETTLWRWLPGSVGETFTAKSGKAALQMKGGALITCQSSKIELKGSELLKEGSSEGKGATLELAIIDFVGCKTLGFAINSKGDATETILVHLELHNCVIKSGDFGILFQPLETTLEVPAAKQT